MANNGLSAAALILAAGKSGGGGGPSEYIKSASVNGNTLTLVKNDGTTIVFTAGEVINPISDNDIEDITGNAFGRAEGSEF